MPLVVYQESDAVVHFKCKLGIRQATANQHASVNRQWMYDVCKCDLQSAERNLHVPTKWINCHFIVKPKSNAAR